MDLSLSTGSCANGCCRMGAECNDGWMMNAWSSRIGPMARSRNHGSAIFLGLLYRHQSKLVGAEEMCMRALQGSEKALGAEHTSTIDAVNNLGTLYSVQGKLVDAEKMLMRALQRYEKALSAEHTPTLNAVNNLGTLYSVQGKLVDA